MIEAQGMQAPMDVVTVDPTTTAGNQVSAWRRATAGLVLAGAVLAGCSTNTGDTTGDTTPTTVVEGPGLPGCENFVQDKAAANSEKYNLEASLPHTDEVKSAKDVKPYLDSLFDEDGPLGGKGDYAVLAFWMALVGEQATDGKPAADPAYSITATFAAKSAAYGAEGGAALAKEDCKKLRGVMNQTAVYDAEWAHEGQGLTLANLHRDDNDDAADGFGKFEPNGMSLDARSAEGGLSVIAFRFNETTREVDGKEVDGFEEWGIHPETGLAYIKGIHPQAGQGVDLKGEQVAPVAPQAGETPADNGDADTEGSSGGASDDVDDNGPDGDDGTCGTEGGECEGDAPGGGGSTGTEGTPTSGTPTSGTPTSGTPTSGTPTTAKATTTTAKATTTTAKATTTTAKATTTTAKATTTTEKPKGEEPTPTTRPGGDGPPN